MITFGIITGGGEDDKLVQIMHRLKGVETIIVGPTSIKADINIKDHFKEGHITKKKNVITKHASNEIIVYSHDYLLPCEGWLNGVEKFGDDWDLCMHKIYNAYGTRFRDWCLAPSVELPAYRKKERLLPYRVNLSRWQYISGAYWVAKKSFMESNPLDEKLMWGDGEDVEWSERVMKTAKHVMNPYSSVMCMRNKLVSFKEMQPDLVKYVEDKYGN